MKSSKRERWHDIEGKYLGQCVWQQRSQNGKALLEGLFHKATGRILIVEKFYEKKLPRDHTSTPWPELESVNVYAPVDPDTNTWDGLEKALAEYGVKQQP